MPTMQQNYQPKPFYCEKCKWQIAVIYREPGRRITQLMILRQPRDPASEKLIGAEYSELHKIFNVMKANDCDVVCGNCGHFNGWFANQTTMAEMLKLRSSKRAACIALEEESRNLVSSVTAASSRLTAADYESLANANS